MKISIIVIFILFMLGCQKDSCEDVDYHPNGQLMMKRCDKGDQYCFNFYYDNGNDESSFCVKKIKKDTLLQGDFLRYFPNGVLDYHENYEKGELNGKQHYYYQNGKIKRTENYILGKKEGLFEQFDSIGELIECKFFVKDEFYYHMQKTNYADSSVILHSYIPRIEINSDTVKREENKIEVYVDLPIPDSLLFGKFLLGCFSKNYFDFEEIFPDDFDKEFTCQELRSNGKIRFEEILPDTGVYEITVLIEDVTIDNDKRDIHNPVYRKIYVVE